MKFKVVLEVEVKQVNLDSTNFPYSGKTPTADDYYCFIVDELAWTQQSFVSIALLEPIQQIKE